MLPKFLVSLFLFFSFTPSYTVVKDNVDYNLSPKAIEFNGLKEQIGATVYLDLTRMQDGSIESTLRYNKNVMSEHEAMVLIADYTNAKGFIRTEADPEISKSK